MSAMVIFIVVDGTFFAATIVAVVFGFFSSPFLSFSVGIHVV